jgi:hypothetical protein
MVNKHGTNAGVPKNVTLSPVIALVLRVSQFKSQTSSINKVTHSMLENGVTHEKTLTASHLIV